MSTIVALVGAQPLPNFFPVEHYHYKDVLLLYTVSKESKKIEAIYENLKATLVEKCKNVYGLKVDPYDIPSIEKALDTEIDKLSTELSWPLGFNLTGGTKAMAMAAYQVAQKYKAPVMYIESEKKGPHIYHYGWENQRLQTISNEILPECIELQDVLNLYLGPKDTAWRKGTPTTDIKHTHLFPLAITQTLSAHGYEVICSVQDIKNTIEIDIMIRYLNHTAIIEVKTGNPTDLYGIKQLSAAMRFLGGAYTRQFFIIDGKPSDSQREICELLNVKIISLPNYQRGLTSTTLTQEDANTLLTAIDKVMKV